MVILTDPPEAPFPEYDLKEQTFDVILQDIHKILQNPPIMNGEVADGLFLPSGVLSKIISELIQLRKSVSSDKQQIIALVTEMTFNKAVAEISVMLEAFSEQEESQALKRAALCIREMKNTSEGPAQPHGRN